jgi:hypothetical protein
MNSSLKKLAFPFVACVLAMLLLSCHAASAEGVRTIHAYAGDNVELTDSTTPDMNVTVSVSSTITVPAGDGRYSSRIEGLYIPPGSRLSLKASPVASLNVNGLIHASTFSSVRTGDISGDVGILLLTDVPDGEYDITIYGESTAPEVTLTVTASQNTVSGPDGAYTVNASSKGLPPGFYSVTANGVHIADVYIEKGKQTIPVPSGYVAPSSGPSPSGMELAIYAVLAIAVCAILLVIADVLFRKRKKG